MIQYCDVSKIIETAIYKSKRKGESQGIKRSFDLIDQDEESRRKVEALEGGLEGESERAEISLKAKWITLADRRLNGTTDINLTSDDVGLLNNSDQISRIDGGYSFEMKNSVLEIDTKLKNVKSLSPSKAKMKRSVLFEISINTKELPTIADELEFFKPMRKFERSDKIMLIEPVISIQLTRLTEYKYTLTASVTYLIKLQECCLFNHPMRAVQQICTLIEGISKLDPVPYEMPYSEEDIVKNGYNTITSSSFYNIISDHRKEQKMSRSGAKFIIPELDATLFDFQATTVNWLLNKEGVSYKEETHTVSRRKFFDSKDTRDENKIAECLDLLSFGWSRVTLPAFGSNEDIGVHFWFNKYTGNLTTSDFAASFLSTVSHVPAQGLLAEEMGLGKTVEVLALILLNQRMHQELDKVIWDPIAQRKIITTKTTLIICPESILKQWYNEIIGLTPNLKISIYKGIFSYNKSVSNQVNSRSYKTPLQIAKNLSKFDVVLASYQTVSREIHHALYNPSSRPKRRCARNSRRKINSLVAEKDEDGNEVGDNISNADSEEYEERNDYSSPLVLLQFWRVVLDEVQMVSSTVSNAAKTAKIIPRYHSWGVSGTPIRKDLNDLHSFLNFANLFPFNNSLPSPKANKMVWEKLIQTNGLPIHFIRLFKNIALRHTKNMVSDDIKLPPQRRVLFTTEFTPIERNLYDHMLQSFLNSVGLNDKGDPTIENWEPNTAVLNLMREWLVKLRQACCHSQIGTGSIIKRSLNTHEDTHLRTVDAVLDLLIDDNEAKVVALERRYILAKVEKGQIFEAYEHPDKSLEVWMECLPEVTNRIDILKKSFQSWESRLKVKPELPFSKEEEQFLLEKVTLFRNRLRSWSDILHRLYFFIASAHYQIYTPKEIRTAEEKVEIPDEELTPEGLEHRKLENEFYDKAELLRRELLSETIGKVNKAVVQIQLKKLKEFLIPTVRDTKQEFIGLEALWFYEKYQSLAGELNRQAEKLNEWFLELNILLCKYLQDNPEGETQRLDDDYEESLIVQDKAYAYLDVIQKALKDRSDALNAVGDQSAVTNLIQRRQDDDDITILKSNDGNSDFHKELETIRQEIRPQAVFQPMQSLRSMVIRGKEIHEGMTGSGPPSLEYELFNGLVGEMKINLDRQKKALSKLKKDYFSQLNDLYNARIEYYKSLQALSDTVTEFEIDRERFQNGQDSDEGIRQQLVDRKILNFDSAKKAAAIRTKYLQSLKDMNSGDEEDEEERICIICQGPIITGVLTACGHQYCRECLDEWLRLNRRSCPMCKAHLDKDSMYNFTYTRSNLKGSLLSGEEHPEQKDLNKILHSIYLPIEEDVIKKIEDVMIYKSYGSKIDLIIKLTKYLLSVEKDVQIVVFSQWSELLYLIGAALKYNGIEYLNSSETLSTRLGSGRRHKRIMDVDNFKKNPKITCFLLNAKAQASGLTLVNASHVFLCEPLVNTSLELQAISRIHRIGQKKPTTIWMFAISETVEESIIKLSTKKRLEYLNGTKKDGDEEIVEEVDASNINETEIDTVSSEEMTKSVEGLVDKKLFGGEVVSNDELWSSFFS